MSTIYKVAHYCNYKRVLITTSDFQKALDCRAAQSTLYYWCIHVYKGNHHKCLRDHEQIQAYAEKLIEEEQTMKFKNRVEHRVYNELQEQEISGMEVVEPRNYLELSDVDDGDEYSNYMRTILGKPVAADFHGDFKAMDKEAQDAIINPKHYKLIPKEAYEEHPEGLEYMDLMEYMLSHHNGVESHSLGQVFKYACRLGKKDADLQDARKIEWYASRLVKTIEKRG
jgi:hypothetical protein